MPQHYSQKNPLILLNGVRAFSGFPYLMTFIVSSFYHFILLPKHWSRETCLEMARLQVLRNRLDTWLVFNKDCIVKHPAYGLPAKVISPPACTIFLADRLMPAREITEDEDLKQRKAQLNKVIENVSGQGGYITGDLTKGGRRPNPREARKPKGLQPDGVPNGLVRCPECGYYRGECLDNNPVHKWLLMKVYCRCQNDNLCARCGRPLAEFKLNANFYEAKTGSILHVPGFCCFRHKCPQS